LFLLFSPEHREMKRESLREGETEKERPRVREFERESLEPGETLVRAERRSG